MLGSLKETKLDLSLGVEDINSGRKMLKYSVPESNYVSIVICDLVGNEIVKVLNDYRKRGTYRCTVDLSALETGVYSCIIKSGSRQQKAEIYALNKNKSGEK